MYCSMVYSMSNIELFFCLYVNSWNNPSQCNSNHSRLLGFFSTLPPIWRLLQCIRRYRDTRNVFPHLVNGGKYTMTIVSYVALSLYRIQESHSNLALFITFSTMNSVYTSIWDLFMDFSLLQVDSRHFMLRDILALKRRWVYYVIMVLDPILRFSWIFYAIFTHDTQHNSICSFLVSFAEATRRGMWSLIRVENEHCANVAQYKASRDVPLPYHLHELDSSIDQAHHPLLQGDEGEAEGDEAQGTIGGGTVRRTGTSAMGVEGTPSVTGGAGGTPSMKGTPGRATLAGSSIRSSKQKQQEQPSPLQPAPGTAGTAASTTTWPNMPEEHGSINAAAAAEEGTAGATDTTGTSTGVAVGSGSPQIPAASGNDFGTLRRRFTSTLGKSIGVIMAEAHKQDFEKKRKPGAMDGASPMGRPGPMDDLPSSDDEDDDDDHHGSAGDDGDDEDLDDLADYDEGVYHDHDERDELGHDDNGVADSQAPTQTASPQTQAQTETQSQSEGRNRGHSHGHHSHGGHSRAGHSRGGRSGGGSSSLKRGSPKP